MFNEFFSEQYGRRNPNARLFHELLEATSRVVNLVEQKDAQHSDRVALNCLRLARRVGISDQITLAQVYFAGLLHDIGEIGVPDSLIYKKGKLSEEEFQVLTTHTAVGQQIASQIPVLANAARLILWHHERWDGTGYPEGLTMDETPMLAQIVSLCDAFDNIRRGGLFSKPEDWDSELMRYAGIQFNPSLVRPLIELTEEGLADDTECSPEDEEVLNAMELQEDVIAQLREDYVSIIVNFLLALLEAKHKESALHSKRVARLCQRVGEQMNLSEQELQTLVIAGNLHDIGKVGIPNSILDKPGMLNDMEYKVIQKHPQYAATILEPLSGFSEVVAAVLHHHERWNGCGYPNGLKGDDIPLLARVLHLCDLADALTHLRSVPKHFAAEQVRYVIEDGFGSYFDPDISRFFEEDALEVEKLEDDA